MGLGQRPCRGTGNRKLASGGPVPRNLTGALDIADDQDELVIMIAVKHFDIDAGLRHQACQLPKLTRHGLLQTLDNDLATLDDADPGALKGPAGCLAILEKKMRSTFASDDPGTASLHTDAGVAERPSHGGQCAGLVIQLDF
jgi:hypothetical protein